MTLCPSTSVRDLSDPRAITVLSDYLGCRGYCPSPKPDLVLNRLILNDETETLSD